MKAIIVPYKGESICHEVATEEEAKALIEKFAKEHYDQGYDALKEAVIMRDDGLLTHLFERDRWK